MTEREYKMVCKLIDLHTNTVVRGDLYSKSPVSLYEEKEINAEHIKELKKDICDLLVDIDEKVGIAKLPCREANNEEEI